MFPDLFRMVDEFFNDKPALVRNNRVNSMTVPSVNVQETTDEYTVELAAPGLTREDFNIELDNGLLTISSERQHREEEKDNDKRWLRREFSYQSFSRSFQLDDNIVDSDRISASYQDGMLRVILPKKEEARPRPARRIEIG